MRLTFNIRRSKKWINLLILIPVSVFLVFELSLFGKGENTFFKLIKSKDVDIEVYLIETPGCKILNFQPAPQLLQRYFINNKKVSCYKGKSFNITFSRRNILYFYPENINRMYLDSEHRERILKLKESVSVGRKSTDALKDILSDAFVKCCYRTIERGNSHLRTGGEVDDEFQLSDDCFNIEQFQSVITGYDGIIVYCSIYNIYESDFYMNVHFLVQDKRKAELDDKNDSGLKKSSKNKLSVIIFGTDSVSRLNFLRVNPQTYNYLVKDLKAFEYKGFNKVGDNTYPHIMALLTGHLWDDEPNTECCKGLKISFDNCTFIWKDFQKEGYVTAFVEDFQCYSSFNYNHRHGFATPPTDHYTRATFLAAERLLTSGCSVCLGGRITTEVLQDYSHDLQVTYQDGLTFSYVWAAELTHDNLNLGTFADEPNVRYLKSLKEDGVLNRSILFYMSDHGFRFGSYRRTDVGKYEENLPYLFIVVPEWFQKRYPLASKNLLENTVKFLTPLDIHETLQDILHERYKDNAYLNDTPPEHDRRISLFKSLPVTRTCSDIGMPLQYCGCQNYVPMENVDNLFQKIVFYLKDYINNLLDNYSECAKVSYLEVNRVLKGYREESLLGETIAMILSVQATYYPGGAIIEATIVWNKMNQKSPFQISGEISRINKYGSQSHCVEHDQIVKLCVCKDTI